MQSNPALRFNPHTYMNPLSRGAKIAIVTTVVVATGVTAFLLWPRSASAAELPPAPVPPTGGGGTTGARVPAPPFPYSQATVGTLEIQAATAAHAQWLQAISSAMASTGNKGQPNSVDIDLARRLANVPGGKTIAGWLTDKAYLELYPQAPKIPAANNRGAGWQAYIESWTRINSFVKGLPLV